MPIADVLPVNNRHFESRLISRKMQHIRANLFAVIGRFPESSRMQKMQLLDFCPILIPDTFVGNRLALGALLAS